LVSIRFWKKKNWHRIFLFILGFDFGYSLLLVDDFVIKFLFGSDWVRRKKKKNPRMLPFKELYPHTCHPKKWLAQNGFSPMKKIASSEEFSVSQANSSSSSSEGEEDYKEGRSRLKGEDSSTCGALFPTQTALSHKRK
jgi:hypothetical protein